MQAGKSVQQLAELRSESGCWIAQVDGGPTFRCRVVSSPLQADVDKYSIPMIANSASWGAMSVPFDFQAMS